MGSFSLRQGPQHRLAGISWRSTVLGFVLVVALLGAAPGVASAAVRVSSGVLLYNARPGDVNDIHIAYNGTDYTVTDSVPIDLAPNGGCTGTGTTATCPGSTVTKIRVNPGDMNDRITIDPSVTVPTELIGGEAGDVINTRNGVQNKVACVSGKALAVTDPIDVVSGCENDDGVPPAVSITKAPTGVTTDPRPAFEFSATGKSPLHFDCTVSGGPTDTTCAPPSYQPAGNVADGPHTFTVKAIDKYGNEASATSASFTIDATAPDTRFDSLPPDPVDTSTPSFSFSSDDPGATFICLFDTGQPFSPCTSPLIPDPPLANGEHTLQVWAVDTAGNRDATPAVFKFTVNAPISAPPLPPGGTTLQKGGTGVPVGSLVLISGRSVKLVKGKLVPVSLTCAGQRKCEGDITVTTDKPVRKAQTRARMSKKGKKRKKKSKPRIQHLGSAHYSIEGNRRAEVLVPLSKSKVRLLKRLKRVKVRATIREVDLHGNPRISTRSFMLRAR